MTNFNQVDIEIGGKVRKLTATMQNLYDIEENVAPIVSLIKKLERGEGLKFKEMMNVIYYGLNGNSDNRLELKSIENNFKDNGYLKYLIPVQSFLYTSLMGGEAAAKGAESPENPTTPVEAS